MKKLTLLSLLALLLVGFSTSKRIDSLIAKEIKAVFKIESYTKSSIAVSEAINKELPIKISEDNLFKINSNSGHIGYYFLGQGYGKTDYFDFIVIFDKDLVVAKVKILVYREDHGGEIGSKRWLRQFTGIIKSDSLKYQKDISAISGATLSARSMTNQVNRMLKTINILYKKEAL